MTGCKQQVQYQITVSISVHWQTALCWCNKIHYHHINLNCEKLLLYWCFLPVITDASAQGLFLTVILMFLACHSYSQLLSDVSYYWDSLCKTLKRMGCMCCYRKMKRRLHQFVNQARDGWRSSVSMMPEQYISSSPIPFLIASSGTYVTTTSGTYFCFLLVVDYIREILNYRSILLLIVSCCFAPFPEHLLA
jgi:hypothetical protein